MGRTSPISSIGDYDEEMRDDDADGWVSDVWLCKGTQVYVCMLFIWK